MAEEVFITVPSEKATPAEITDFMQKLYIRDIQRVGRDNSAHAAKSAKAGHDAGVGDHSHQSAGKEGGLLDHGLAMTPGSQGDDDHTLYYRADGTRPISGALDHDGTTVGLYAKTPVAQAVAAANLTDNSGGTANDVVEAISALVNSPAALADAAERAEVNTRLTAIRNDVADLVAKVNKALAVLRDVGLMAT